MLAGTLVLIVALDPDAEPAIVTAPLLLMGLGMGALASQLGAVTVSAVPDKLSGEVGGLQNTATNLGAALGTALAGSILIAALTVSFLTSVTDNPDIPSSVKDQANIQLAGGIPFMSDADLQTALDEAQVPPEVAAAAIEANDQARVDGLRSALSVLALIALSGLFFARGIPNAPKSAPGEPNHIESASSSSANSLTARAKPSALLILELAETMRAVPTKGASVIRTC